MTAQFKGNGYLELNSSSISNSSIQLTTGLALLFSTHQPNGILLWYGQNKDKAYNGDDFVALAVVDGLLEYSFRLDGEESVINNVNTRVDDGGRHIAIIKRTGNQASLEVDHFTQYGESRPSAKKEMILPGHIFLGDFFNTF